MAKSKSQFKRYLVINDLLQGGKKVKTKQILKCLQENHDISVDAKTIQNDIRDMRYDSHLGYEAPIENDTKTKSWYYSDSNYTINSKIVIKEEESEAFIFYLGLLNRYNKSTHFQPVENLIKKILRKLNLSKRYNLDDLDKILFIDHSPSTIDYGEIVRVIEAILERKELQFTYKKFSDDTGKRRVLQPCIIREYGDRWYVLGLEKPSMRSKIFAFDRMSNLMVTRNIFDNPNIDWEDFYKHSMGVTTGDFDPIVIKLFFPKDQIGYIKSKKIHPTQKIIEETTNGIIVTIEVRPTWEFYSKMLGYGASVKVLEPANVVEMLREKLSQALKQY